MSGQVPTVASYGDSPSLPRNPLSKMESGQYDHLEASDTFR